MPREIQIARSPRIPRHLIVAASSWASRLLTALVQVASVRILMDSLGLEHYAVFALLTGLAGWFLLADLGVGVSVQNYISESRAKNEPYDDLLVVSGLLAVLMLVVTIFALYFITPYLAGLLFRNFPFLSEAEKLRLFFVTGALSLGFGVGGIVYKIWYAEQKGYLSNIVPAAATLVGFAGLLLARQVPSESRLFISLAVFMAPAAVFPLVALLKRQLRKGFKLTGAKRSELVGKILKRGLHFWFFALMAAGVLQVDYIVMSQFLVPHDIAAYNVATKIFGLAFFIYGAALLALWPVFAESVAKGNWGLVWGHMKRYLIFGLTFMLICTILLIWLMPMAVQALAPKENIVIPVGFILLMGAYQTLRVWTDTFGVLLQSMNKIASLWALVPIQAIVCVGLQCLLAPRFGIHGIVMGLIGSYILTVTWGAPLAAWKNYRVA